jgi:hypothetical protein
MIDRIERRTFFRRAGAMLAATSIAPAIATSIVRRAFGEDDLGDTHEVPPPDGFEFRTMTFEKSIMLGRNAKVIAAIPRDLPSGTKLPMAVLLPGGIHGKQPPDRGCWAWWSDFHLGDTLATLRRGHIESNDAQGLLNDAQLAAMNATLAAHPWQPMVIVTPWVLSRQTNPVPHGEMVTPFLRQLVERARAELPVIATRESTALAGCSVGGLWSMYCGAQLSDWFSTLVAVQPFTEDLERLLRKTLKARTAPQRLRMVTALQDRLRPMNVKLAGLLEKDGIDLELVEYPGDHNWKFPAGPGGLDMLMTIDAALERPAPAVALAPSPAPAPAPSPAIASAPVSAPAPAASPSRTPWLVAGAASALAVAFALSRRRRS